MKNRIFLLEYIILKTQLIIIFTIIYATIIPLIIKI